MATPPFTFDDSNAFRWSYQGTLTGKTAAVVVEKDAPYTKRTLQVPSTMTEKEIRAFVEAAVAVPQKGKAQAFRPAKKATDTLKPLTPPAAKSDGGGMLLLALLALLVLSKKGRS
jgi:hypothetical protein